MAPVKVIGQVCMAAYVDAVKMEKSGWISSCYIISNRFPLVF